MPTNTHMGRKSCCTGTNFPEPVGIRRSSYFCGLSLTANSFIIWSRSSRKRVVLSPSHFLLEIPFVIYSQLVGQAERKLEGRVARVCRSTKRCRRSPKSCRVCRTRRRSTSKTLVTVLKRCECSIEENEEKQARFQARSIVERKQISWKEKSRPCRQERKEEAYVRHGPMDVD